MATSTRRRKVRARLTSQTRVIELDVPQSRLVQRIQLRLVDLGHVLEVLGITGIHALLPSLVLLIPHVEPRRRNERQLDIRPLLLGQRGLDELQFVQVALRALAARPAQLAAGNHAVARHDLAVLFNQRHHVRVVQAEHGCLGLLQRDGPVKLVPHETPESRPVVLARGDGAEAGILLQLDDVRDGLLLERGQACGLGGLALPDGLARVEEGLGPQQRAHVFCTEGGCHFFLVWVGRKDACVYVCE